MDQVRQYQILERIDSGAENIVYLGRDSRSDRNVAIRLVRLHDFVAPEAVEEFQRQLNADLRQARKLIHPAVVTDYELFEEFGLTWVVMELVDGEIVDELLRSTDGLDGKQALEILHQLADCLDHAHEMGVVHGDIRPRYVVVEPSGAVRLLSFGLRRIAELATQGDARPATERPAHMAPEQWSRREAGPPSDQFGLGALAYRLFAGEISTPAGSNGSGRPQPAAKLNPSLGENAGAVIDRALSPNGAERFGNCREFVRRLEEALRHQPDWRLAGAPEEAPPEPEPDLPEASSEDETVATPSPLITPFPTNEAGQLAPIGPLPDSEFDETGVNFAPNPTPWPDDFIREGPIDYEGPREREPRRIFGIPLPWALGMAAAVVLAVLVAVAIWRGSEPAMAPRQQLAFRAAQIPAPVVGQPFAYQFAIQGGTAPYRWSVTRGQLPPGLELDIEAGEIRGTPNAPGSYGFEVAAQDATGETITVESVLRARAGVAIVSESALPSGVLDVAYDHQLLAVDGQQPYEWRLSDNILPPGLRLDASGGRVTGTPTAAGQFPFRIRVLDGAGKTSEADFSLEIGSGLTVTTSPALPRAVSTVDYSAQLAAAGGEPPFQWTVVNGVLPPEFSLGGTSGTVSGRTTSDGVYQFTAQVSDARGTTAVRAFSLTVGAPLTVDSLGQITEAVVGEPYQFYFASSGGVRPHVWSLSAGSLPGGLYLDGETGALRGTPEQSGRYQFSVAVSDDAGSEDTGAVTLTVGEGLNIVSEALLPPAESDTGYAARLNAQGGVEPRVWTVLDGRLPPGLALAPNTGQITGVPSAEGEFRFTIGVTDAGSESISREFTLQVTPRLAIQTGGTLPDAELNDPYNHTLSVTGGRPPFRWSVVSQQLPSGLQLDEETGRISGTPTRPGNFRFRVRALSAADTSATKELTLRVAETGTGRLVWTGELPANRVLTIQEGKFASGGQLQGELPGVPVTISLDPPDLNLVTAPGPGNDWKLIVIHSGARARARITVSWRIIR